MAVVNTNDPRLKSITDEKNSAIQESNQFYQGMVNSTDQYYNDQIEASKEWANKQQELQQQRTDFEIEKIEQQKDQAGKDYTKEQKASYQDYMKQQNAYGSQNQAMGQRGLGGSGWSETTQSGYWNTYQGRVATAKESYDKIILDYNNGIKEAQLANNSALAQIAYEAQQQQLELALKGFEYKNQLLLQQQEAQRSIDQEYNNRWNTVWEQLMKEAEYKEQVAQFEKEFDLKAKQIEAQIREINESIKASQASRSFYGSLTDSSGYEVSTDYYQGSLNNDAKIYGTFSNGYQPKGISGHGKLTSSGKKYSFVTYTLDGQKKTSTQTVWKAADGTLWYWEGRQNKYLQYKGSVSSSKKSTSKKASSGGGGSW